MYRFNDVSLPMRTSIRASLTKIYGLGLQKSSHLVETIGLGAKFSMSRINRYYFELIINILKIHWVITTRLKELIDQRTKFYFELKFIKGIRLKKGLPVRGQRTHSNGKTLKKQIRGDSVSLTIKRDERIYRPNRHKMKGRG